MGIKDSIRGAISRKFPAISHGDTLETAVKVMAQSNVSALVVEQDNELTGIVTITDIMCSISSGDDFLETKVSSFMTVCDFITKKGTKNPCVQLDESEDAITAIQIMYESGVNHLLISGSKGEPVGMVSSLELIKRLAS